MGTSTLRNPIALCGVAAMFGILGATFSIDNSLLWLVSAATILACGILLRREGAIVPTLLTITLLYWIEVVADLMYADRLGVSVTTLGGGAYRSEAMYISFLALILIVLGIKIGFRLDSIQKTNFVSKTKNAYISVRNAAIFYMLSFSLSFSLVKLASISPGLAQPVLALANLHLVALFILTRALLGKPNGSTLIVVTLSLETALGLLGGIASYQDAYFIVFAAALTSNDTRFGTREFLSMAIALVGLIYISIVWTAIKPEYRSLLNVVDLSATEKISWILSKITNGDINYGRAYTAFLARIGYTEYYGRSLARYDLGAIPETHMWWSAIQNVLMPRALFPDKAALDDTAITTLMTGEQFQVGTSVSVGYVAQAHVDFGFPLMFVPLLLLGAALGLATRHFMASNGQEFVKSGFAASIAVTTFQFAQNIDKLIGGFSLATLGLFLLFRWRDLIASYLLISVRPDVTPKGRCFNHRRP